MCNRHCSSRYPPQRLMYDVAQLVIYFVRFAGYGPMGIHHEWKRDENGLRTPSP